LSNQPLSSFIYISNAPVILTLQGVVVTNVAYSGSLIYTDVTTSVITVTGCTFNNVSSTECLFALYGDASFSNTVFNNDSNNENDPICSYQNYANNMLTLNNVMFFNNTNGGNVYTENNCTVVNCSFVLTNCIGNVFYISGYSPLVATFTDCTFNQNLYGSAIYSSGDNLTMTVTNSQFINNTQAGGVYIDTNLGGTYTFINDTFMGNTNPNDGGAIYLGGVTSSYMSVINCIITNNSAYNSGGIYQDSGQIMISSSMINGNAGGGLYFNTLTNVIVTNSTIMNNIGGGGVQATCSSSSSLIQFYNVTITGNSGYSSGGVYFYNQNNLNVFTMTNCVLQNNTASGIYYPTTNDLYCNVYNISGTICQCLSAGYNFNDCNNCFSGLYGSSCNQACSCPAGDPCNSVTGICSTTSSKHSSTKHSSTKHSSTQHTSSEHSSTKHSSTKHSSTKHTSSEHSSTKHSGTISNNASASFLFVSLMILFALNLFI